MIKLLVIFFIRKDQNQYGSGILFKFFQQMPFKAIESKKLPKNLEILTLEIISDKIKSSFISLFYLV